jgi:alpha-1,6-mannosyltransferase
LYVGRLAREKNVLQLIRMMDRIPAAERVVLLMVGDGEQRRLVEQMAAERNHIRWLPYCADPAILAAYYSAADVFVHPGTNETFGLVALEAQACGTPVVAVRNGGVDSTLMYEPEPAFAERAAPDELLAATLRVLARNETEVDRAARRQRMLTHFSREVSCLRIFGLYEKVCAVYPCNTVVAQPEFKWIEAHG